MERVRPDETTQRLLEPVWPTLEQAVARLPAGPHVQVTVGEVPGFYRLHGDRLILSSALVGPQVHHPEEPVQPLPPLDRWRRAAGSVLEALVLRWLSAEVGEPVGRDWVWTGAAIEAAHQAAPQLELALPDLAAALYTGDLARYPRAGAAAMAAWRAAGHDPLDRAAYVLGGGILSPDEWLGLGRWVFGAQGVARLLPVLVERAAPVDIPARLAPWTWAPLRVPAHPRGGRIGCTGDAAVDQPWARAGEEHQALAGAAAAGGGLIAEVGGPTGAWVVATAEGFGQILGARGITFRFDGSGRLELLLADAFVGPLAALAMSEEVGTSGVVDGRWQVEGPHRIRISGIRTHNLTMHGRRSDRFLVPAQGFGLGEWLHALQDHPWSWQESTDRLVLRGHMLGGAVEVRLRREAGEGAPAG